MDRGEVPEYGFRRTPAERLARAVLPASGAVWTAAEILHLAGVQGAATQAAIGTALVSATAWGASGRWRKIPPSLPRWTAAAGTWLTAAVAEGPLHWWPYAPLTWTWCAASLVAWRMAQRHEAVLAARQWRDARAGWLGRARNYGLGGSHLLEYEETRLGERFVADVRGTGKRASQIAGSHVAELIAEDEGLPVSRVRVRPSRLAGRVEVSIRRIDPWASPILHPVIADDPEVDLPFPCTIRDAVVIGQDPETGRVLLLTVFDETGGKCIVIVSLRGGGKTVLLDCLSERVTAASDALQVRINLSVKGHAEAERWGPACHLTAFGPHQKTRAARVLHVVNQVIEWRAQRYTTGKYIPSAADPLWVVIVDEADSAMAVPAVRKEINDIATKGREYGVTLVRAGQRGTIDYGSAKTRAQDDVFCVGKVNRQGEVYHAAGSMGFALPDMASYGEGHSGVWAVAELGGGHRTGRTFLLEAGDVARIAAERAFSQPDLHPDCREFLGESYEILLGTDVFARWARDRVPVASGRSSPPGGDSAVSPVSPPAVTLDEKDIEYLDFDMDDDSRAQLAALDAKNGRTRQLLAETAALPKPPEVSPEALAAHTAERWRQVGEQAQIPEAARPVLLGLLREGTTAAAVAEAIGVSKWIARTYLERLRNEGAAYVDGEKRNARWRLIAAPGDGDGT